MRGSIPCGSVLGIRLRVHITFVILLAWIMWLGWEAEGWSGSLWSGAILTSLFLCVLLHEFGHCLVAMRFGVQAYSITLLPIGGVASMSRIPENPREEFLIAVAGPMVNVIIASVLILLTGGIPDVFSGLDALPHSLRELVPQIIRTNIILVLFNMIPAYPMDGGRVLRSGLATVLPYATATTIAARVGQVVAIGFVLFGFQLSPLLPLIGIFIIWAAGSEIRLMRIRLALDGVRVKDMMRRCPVSLSPDDALARCAEIAHETGQRDFAVIDEGRPVGILPQARWMIELQRRDAVATPVHRVMVRRFPSIHGDADAFKLFQDLRIVRQKCFAVVEDGAIAGFVDAGDIVRYAEGDTFSHAADTWPAAQPPQRGIGPPIDLG